MADDTAPGVIDKIQKGLDVIDKITRAINIVRGEPVSIGDREKIEECIRELTVAEQFEQAEACRVKSKQKGWTYTIEFFRIGIKTDELTGTVTFRWSHDGCGLYDMFATETHTPNNSDWEVRLIPRIYPLNTKERGDCPCCREGGLCVLVHMEWEVERRISFWPNSTLTLSRSGIICASDGVFRRIE
jgi:hypothetical protein